MGSAGGASSSSRDTPHHASGDDRPHRSDLGGAHGPLYRLSALWGPESSFLRHGEAYTSNDFEAVCRRLQMQHETIESTQGESYQNLMETHFNIQRRLYDYQFSPARTPAELEERHQAFIRRITPPPIKGS